LPDLLQRRAVRRPFRSSRRIKWRPARPKPRRRCGRRSPN
jgi:hypothetical protein